MNRWILRPQRVAQRRKQEPAEGGHRAANQASSLSQWEVPSDLSDQIQLQTTIFTIILRTWQQYANSPCNLAVSCSVCISCSSIQMFSLLLTEDCLSMPPPAPPHPPPHPSATVAPPSGISGIKAILVCRSHFQMALLVLFIFSSLSRGSLRLFSLSYRTPPHSPPCPPLPPRSHESAVGGSFA